MTPSRPKNKEQEGAIITSAINALREVVGDATVVEVERGPLDDPSKDREIVVCLSDEELDNH